MCLCGPSSLPWNLVFCNLSPLQSLKTNLVVSLQRTTCIHVNAASMLPLVSASFSNSFKTESSVQNNVLLQCRYLTLGPKLCLEYLSNPLQINFLATGTLAANDFHSALPMPVRLLKYSSCVSWSRWYMRFVILLMYHICCIFLIPLCRAFKQGGVRAILRCLDSPFLMIFAQTCHMSCIIDYLSAQGYQSHSETLTCVDRDSYQSRLGLTTL